MHTAICFQCGTIKLNPFTECIACKTVPLTLDDFVYSEALTTLYIDPRSLGDIGDQIRNGKRIMLRSQDYSTILISIESRIETMPLTLKSIFGVVAPKPDYQPQESYLYRSILEYRETFFALFRRN